MQSYRVDGGTLRLGQGAIVGLTDEQAAPRMRAMERMSAGVYRVRQSIEFKSGEIIKVDANDIPKHSIGIVVPLDGETPPVKPRVGRPPKAVSA